MSDIEFERITLTELHRSTGDAIAAAAYGLPTLVEKRGSPFVLILPARDLSGAADMVARIAEQIDQETKGPPGRST